MWTAKLKRLEMTHNNAMPRLHGVPDWWNDQYHAYFNQFTEHLNREFADIPVPTNRQGFSDIVGHEPDPKSIREREVWWSEPMDRQVLDWRDDRYVDCVNVFFLTPTGWQFQLPVYLTALLDPDYDLGPYDDVVLERIACADERVVSPLTDGQKRVIRQFLEMMRLQGGQSARAGIAVPWGQFAPAWAVAASGINGYWSQFPPFFDIPIDEEY